MSENRPHSRPFVGTARLIGSGLIICLLLIRFFMIAESASMGDSLWIVALWCAMLALWAAVLRGSQGLIFGWLDAGVGLFVTGHITSAVAVIITSGDKRSAVNLAWEWMGIAAAWFLLRQLCRQAAFRRELVIGLISTGTAVAALGLYQHFIDFPQTAAKYGPMIDRLKQADPAEAANLRRELAREHIPVEGAALILFDKRLRDSREPLGFFALANTLGGFLGICLVLAVCISGSQWQSGDRGWQHVGAWALISSNLALCLVLTKSRTAWIGATMGLMLWFFGTRFTKLHRVHFRVVTAALIIAGVVGWGLFQFGGLDRQVLTEAPKSLQYRLNYWAATWKMIKDHPWLGVGLGQFRANYLFDKLPEASEEISDPHNLFLDTAANGGIAALIGLLAVCVVLVSRLRSAPTVDRDAEIPPDNLLVPCSVTACAAVAWLIFLFSGDDDRLLWILPVTVAFLWGIRRIVGRSHASFGAIRWGSIAAAISLLVHLMGAGGIGMPAITLLLLTLAALADGQMSGAISLSSRMSTLWSGLLLVFGIGLTIAVYLTGIRPVSEVVRRVSAGDQFFERGQLQAADAEYSAAAKADPFADEPWRRRAELAFRRAEAQQFQSNDSFLSAVRLMEEARSRNPGLFQLDRNLGFWWQARWQVTKQSGDAQEAVAAFQRAWSKYPTNAQLMADLAFALESAGTVSEAAGIAEKATRQDNINHQYQHVDRYLSDPIRTRLNQLTASHSEGRKEE